MSLENAENHLKSIIEQMSLSEKVSLLSGKDMWHMVSIPRRSICRL